MFKLVGLGLGLVIGLALAKTTLATKEKRPVPAVTKAIPDESIYQLTSPWTTDKGEHIHLEKLRGKIRVLTLFFGNCESSCPMVLGTLKNMETALPVGWGKQGGIVLVSLDPRRDSVESLANFRKRMSLDPERWILLRGSEQDTRELAMTLGVAYRPAKENGGMEHNAVVVILDQEGRILKRHEGTIDAKELTSEFKSAISGVKF